MVATNSGLWYAGDKPVVAAYNRGEQVYPLDLGTDPKVNESYFTTFINDKFLQVLDQQIHYKHVSGVTFFTRITATKPIAPTNAAAWTSDAPAGAYEFDFDWSHDASWSGLPFKRINPETIPDYIFDCMNYPTEWTQNDSDGKARYPYGGYHTLYIPKADRRSTVADVRNVFFTTKELMWQAPGAPADLPDQIYFVEINNKDAYDFTAWNGETLTKPATVTLMVGVSGNNLIIPEDYTNSTKIVLDYAGGTSHYSPIFKQHTGTGHFYIKTQRMDLNAYVPGTPEDRWFRFEFDGSLIDTVGLPETDPNLVNFPGFNSSSQFTDKDVQLATAINSGDLTPTLAGPESNYHGAEWRKCEYVGGWAYAPVRYDIHLSEYQHKTLVRHALVGREANSQCFDMPSNTLMGSSSKWRAWVWED